MFEKKFRDLHPERAELDWRNGVRRPARSAVARRSAQGQLCGVQAPPGQKCTNCAEAKGTFYNCRIVFVEDKVQWMWSCAKCAFVGGNHKCSFRKTAVLANCNKTNIQIGPNLSSKVPSWVVEAVTKRQPGNELLKTYYGRKPAAATPETAKSTSRKRPTAMTQSSPEQIGIDQASLHSPAIKRAKRIPLRRNTVSKSTPVAPKGIDKENPAKRRKSDVGPSKASVPDTAKRRRSEVAPARTSEGATTDTAKQPGVAPTKANEGAAKDAPKLKNGGLPFNMAWYNSPLEKPEVYRMKDKSYALDTYNDLADILARITEDQSRMKAALVRKGFFPKSDDEESEEENVFALV